MTTDSAQTFGTEIAIVIPAFNPPKTELDQILNDLVKLKNSIIIIDDGSAPDYAQYFSEIQNRPAVKVISHTRNSGKGEAIKTALRFLDRCTNVRGVVTADADGQHSPADIKRVLACASVAPNIPILGVRNFDLDTPLRSLLGNIVTSFVIFIIYSVVISDTQTGLRYYPRHLFERLKSIKESKYQFELTALVSIIKNKFKTIDINTIYINKNKSSHFRKISDSILIYSSIIRYGFAGISCFLCDVAAFTAFSYLGFSGVESALMARLLSGTLNFWINRKWVFRGDRANSVSQFISYCCLAFFSSFTSGLIADIFSEDLKEIIILKILADGFLAGVNYTIQRKYIFKK